MYRLSIILCLAVSGAPLAGQASTPGTMEVEDLFRVQQVGSPVVSPDGAHVAYVVSTEDLEGNSSRSDVWMLRLPDGEPRRMTWDEASASAPAFSPDGRYLSFLSSRGEDGAQVWAMDLRGGEARPLTELDRSVSDYAWSPDATRLALLLRDPPPDRGDDAPPPPHVVDRLQFKQDYRGYLDRRRSHLHVMELATDSIVQLTCGDYDHGSMTWSPDGSRIAFVSNRTEEPDANYDSDVWVVEASDPEGEPRKVSPGSGSDGSPAWSPDGGTVAWLTTLRPEVGGYAMSHLAVGAPGSDPRILTEALDRNVTQPRFTDDGSRILALLESEGSQLLLSVPVDGAAPDTLWGGARRVEGFAPVPGSGGAVVVRASTSDAPSELWLLGSSGMPRRLTRHNDPLMDELRLGRVIKEEVTGPDGTRLEAFYTFPPGEAPGSASDLPTILWIHGGPMGQDSWGWHGLRHLFAAHGYLVVQPNYRGSHGYGQEFALGLWQAWGGPESVDAIASVDHAIARGWADPDRLGVGGWSYGAITTNAIITRTPRFDAAISGAGAALHVASWGHDQYQRWYVQELGFPWESRALWERLSPFYRVDEIMTPTLWMGGEHDWNVPILQSEIMYQSMRHLGRETLLVVYPDQGHGGFPPTYEADRYRRFLGWFGHYLGTNDGMWPGSWPETLRR